MLVNIFLFELQQRLRRISTWVYFVVFFGLGCLFVLMSGGAFAGASVDFGTGGKVLINSPYALNSVITFISFFGLVITAAIAGQATYQDIDSNCADFFYTAPITKLDYLGGRFLAAFVLQVFIFSSVGLGAWLGTVMPWLDKTRLGPQMVGAYFQPYFINVLPNLLFLTAIFFALAALSRKMLPVYVASVLVLIGYFAIGQLSGTALTVSVRAALADPLGGAAIDRITRYWTPFQRNTQLIPLQGILLANRALWLGVGALFFVVAYTKFAFAYPAEKSKRRDAGQGEELPSTAQSLPIAHPVFSGAASLRHLLSLTSIQFRETTKNVFFWVLMLAGFLFSILTAIGITNPLSNRTWPVTHWFGLVRRTCWSKELSGSNRPLVFTKGGLVWDDRNPNDSAASRAEAAIDPSGMRRRPRLRVGCPVCGALSARPISACVHTVDPATSNRTSQWQITVPPFITSGFNGLSISQQRIEVLEVRIEPQFVIHYACPDLLRVP